MAGGQHNNDVEAEAQYAFADGIIVITIRGEFTADHVIRLRKDFLADPEFRPGMPSLYDLREASMTLMTSNELRRVAAHGGEIAEKRGLHRTALLVSGAVGYGLSQMYRVLGERPDLVAEVFRDEDAALAWLRSPAAADE